ncbi:MAG: 8-amino-7-oxononanoate synthase [Gammaproteobacteria bacterium]|nr:MAG: 8-amino-7-oxononanoate synthase [Gammaproteobacteria bacterium]
MRLEAARMQARASEGVRRRQLRVDDGPLHCRMGEYEGISFCGNDYLNLSTHPAVREAMKKAIDRYGSGSCASQLVCGHLPVHRDLEERLAQWLGRESVLLFGSAYQANLGVVPALAGRGDQVHCDRLCHASLIDGARLSGARLRRYRHADTDQLEQRLAAPGEGLKLVLTDSVFSMDGDLAPLPELAAACSRQGAVLMVDDAHGIGVLGRNGAGALEATGLDTCDVPVLTGGFGKALGCSGGFVAGTAELIDHLVQHARSAIYSTAPAPAIAAGVTAAIGVVLDEPWRRARLRENIGYFRRRAAGLGLELPGPEGPIQPVILGAAGRALRVARRLCEQGHLVMAIRPPTVPAGTARLRITLTAQHETAQIDALLVALAGILARDPDPGA